MHTQYFDFESGISSKERNRIFDHLHTEIRKVKLELSNNKNIDLIMAHEAQKGAVSDADGAQVCNCRCCVCVSVCMNLCVSVCIICIHTCVATFVFCVSA
jgi:hypothetical protein